MARIVIEEPCHICGQYEEHDLWCSARGVKRRVLERDSLASQLYPILVGVHYAGETGRPLIELGRFTDLITDVVDVLAAGSEQTGGDL